MRQLVVITDAYSIFAYVASLSVVFTVKPTSKNYSANSILLLLRRHYAVLVRQNLSTNAACLLLQFCWLGVSALLAHPHLK
jgi:hypothetical protein